MVGHSNSGPRVTEAWIRFRVWLIYEKWLIWAWLRMLPSLLLLEFWRRVNLALDLILLMLGGKK